MGFLVGFIMLLWDGGLECFHNSFRILGPPLGPARCEANVKLDDHVVIVTGASSGIGKETSLQLAKRGAKVSKHCFISRVSYKNYHKNYSDNKSKLYF